jgi:hypothetical protein
LHAGTIPGSNPLAVLVLNALLAEPQIDLFMVDLLSIAMRSIAIYLLVSVGISSVMANPVPVDPEILIDTGGDAFDINYDGYPITISSNGGGIFAFHNVTGGPLSEVDINLLFHVPQLNIAVRGTFASTAQGQSYSFEPITLWQSDCNGNSSDSESCLELQFSATPGPLVPTDGNFIFDFNNRANYNAADFAVLAGDWNPSLGQGGGGGWPNVSGNIEPDAAVPEPSYRATAGFMSLALLGAWNYRRRLITKKS